jgi:hypothetical protein
MSRLSRLAALAVAALCLSVAVHGGCYYPNSFVKNGVLKYKLEGWAPKDTAGLSGPALKWAQDDNQMKAARLANLNAVLSETSAALGGAVVFREDASAADAVTFVFGTGSDTCPVGNKGGSDTKCTFSGEFPVTLVGTLMSKRARKEGGRGACVT